MRRCPYCNGRNCSWMGAWFVCSDCRDSGIDLNLERQMKEARLASVQRPSEVTERTDGSEA